MFEEICENDCKEIVITRQGALHLYEWIEETRQATLNQDKKIRAHVASKKILLEVHEVQKQADWIEKRYHIIYHGAVSEDS